MGFRKRYINQGIIVGFTGLMTLMLAGCSGNESTVAKTPTPSESSTTVAPTNPAEPTESSSNEEQSIDLPSSVQQPATTLDRCRVNLAAPAIIQAVLTLPIDSRSKQPWNPEPIAGNYNECTDLSAVIVRANTNTPHPATRALLFHLGQYVASATPDTYGFDGIVLNQCTPTTVTLRNSSGIAGLSGIVQFRWNGKGVDIISSAKKKNSSSAPS